MVIRAKAQSALLTKYLESYQKRPRSRVFAPLAEIYRKIGLIDEALKILKEGLKYHPQYVLGYIVLAECYQELGKLDLARETLRPFVPLYRDNISLQKLYAELSLELRDDEEALETFKFILFHLPKDEEIAKKVAQLEAKHEKLPYTELPIIPTTRTEISEHFVIDDDQWVQLNFAEKMERSKGLVKPEEIQVMQRQLDDDFFSDDPDVDDEQEEDTDKDNEDVADPIISLTLVDLYLQQDYKDKAIELLMRIQQQFPERSDVNKKLQELQAEEIHDSGENALNDILQQKIFKVDVTKMAKLFERYHQKILKKSKEVLQEDYV